ncbi:MAG: hypothetical protein ACLS61_09710 [Ruminococcus sp.]
MEVQVVLSTGTNYNLVDDDELIDKAKETLNYMMFPDKAGVAAELLSLLGSNDLDDDTKIYMDDNLKDNVKTDGTLLL